MCRLLNDNSKVGDDTQGDEQSDRKMVAAFHQSLGGLKYGSMDKNERGELKNGPPHPGDSYEKPKRFDDQFAIHHYAVSDARQLNYSLLEAASGP